MPTTPCCKNAPRCRPPYRFVLAVTWNMSSRISVPNPCIVDLSSNACLQVNYHTLFPPQSLGTCLCHPMRRIQGSSSLSYPPLPPLHPHPRLQSSHTLYAESKPHSLSEWHNCKTRLQAEKQRMEIGMQQRVDAAVAENEMRTRGQREASEKNVHFSARVVALNSRLQASLNLEVKTKNGHATV